MEVGRMSREILGRRARNFYGNNDDFSLCWCASDAEKGKFLKKNSIHRLFHIKTRMEIWPFRLGLESKIRIQNGSGRRSRWIRKESIPARLERVWLGKFKNIREVLIGRVKKPLWEDGGGKWDENKPDEKKQWKKPDEVGGGTKKTRTETTNCFIRSRDIAAFG